MRTRNRRRLHILEWLLWISAGLFGGVYGWTYLDRGVYQAYTEWSFEQRLQGRTVSPLLFLSDRLHITQPASRAANTDQLGSFTPSVTQPRLRDGSVVGRLEIPRLQVRAMILAGTSEKTLRRAVGLIDGTVAPGERGNSGIAGHRDTFFLGLRDARRGDQIRIRTLDGEYLYRVQSVQIVEPKEVQVLAATESPELTLVTCYPFNAVGSAPQRWIVKARQETQTAAFRAR